MELPFVSDLRASVLCVHVAASSILCAPSHVENMPVPLLLCLFFLAEWVPLNVPPLLALPSL